MLECKLGLYYEFYWENREDKMNNSVDNLKGTDKNNAMALGCYTAYNVLLLSFYLLEVIKGSRTWGYYVIFAILSLVPLVMCHICYRVNKESDKLKLIIAIGYPIFYTYTIFTTVSPLAFLYGILILVVMLVYAETLLTSIFGGVIFLINVAHVIYLVATGELVKADLPDIEIRLAFTLVLVIFANLITKTMVKLNQARMAHIESEKEHIEEMLSQIMDISNTMTNSIGVVYEKMEQLEESVSKTKESMEEVSHGTTDTAESVQMQLMKTEEIQDFISKVEEVSGTIDTEVEDATEEINQGKEKIDELIKQVGISDDASSKVSKELNELVEYTGNMQSIIELIDNITSQTSLLSLNASIEAARVGEAGKGFAVVASEISNLAEQTQNATVEITELINNISSELEEVVAVVNYLMDNNKLQSIAATETASSFETVASRVADIREQAKEMTEIVVDLANSNESIVESIQTISAATEEVTAHSNVTLECSEENSSIVDEVGEIVCELQSLANRLNNLERQQA